MNFTVIDKAKWDRKECFEHFINNEAVHTALQLMWILQI